MPPGFQKGTLFQLPKLAVMPSFMMNFGGKPPISLLFFANFWITHPCLWKICRKRDPCLENLGTQKPAHMGGTYPYPQHVMYPPPVQLIDLSRFVGIMLCQVTIFLRADRHFLGSKIANIVACSFNHFVHLKLLRLQEKRKPNRIHSPWL